MPLSARAARLHQDSIIIDPCVQYLLGRSDRSDRSGLTAVGLTIPMPNEDAAQTYPRVQQFLEIIHAEPTFCLADSPAAIRRAKAEGKLAHILLSQDALFVGANPKALLLWKQLGLRICQLTYNEKNLLGDGCLERNDGGLSQLGRVMVREMERYGITIDLTHAGRRTFMDICAAATGAAHRLALESQGGRRQPAQHRRRPDARRGSVGRGGLRHHLGPAHLGRPAGDADPGRLAALPRLRRGAGRDRSRRRSRPTRWARWGPIPATRAIPTPCPTGR